MLRFTGEQGNTFAQLSDHELLVTIDTLGKR